MERRAASSGFSVGDAALVVGAAGIVYLAWQVYQASATLSALGGVVGPLLANVSTTPITPSAP